MDCDLLCDWLRSADTLLTDTDRLKLCERDCERDWDSDAAILSLLTDSACDNVWLRLFDCEPLRDIEPERVTDIDWDKLCETERDLLKVCEADLLRERDKLMLCERERERLPRLNTMDSLRLFDLLRLADPDGTDAQRLRLLEVDRLCDIDMLRLASAPPTPYSAIS